MAENRQIVLDTETTGLETSQGHRIIEIGGVELLNRRFTGKTYHQYINPEREIDAGALEVHGITAEFLADKPVFSEVVDDFMAFADGAELVIHNAPFDIGFIDYELGLIEPARESITKTCSVLDSLVLARQMHPGQRNSLDALCKRYAVDNSSRELHGALLDAEILADVYLLMTGGQVSLGLGADSISSDSGQSEVVYTPIPSDRPQLKVIRPSDQELGAHEAYLESLSKLTDKVVWLADKP